MQSVLYTSLFGILCVLELLIKIRASQETADIGKSIISEHTAHVWPLRVDIALVFLVEKRAFILVRVIVCHRKHHIVIE